MAIVIFKMTSSQNTSDMKRDDKNVTKTPQDKRIWYPTPGSWNSHREHIRGGNSYL